MEKIVIIVGGFLLVSAVAELLAKNPEPWARRFLIGRHDWSRFRPKRFKQIHVSMTLAVALLFGLFPFVPTVGLPWILGAMILVLIAGKILIRRHAFKKGVPDR